MFCFKSVGLYRRTAGKLLESEFWASKYSPRPTHVMISHPTTFEASSFSLNDFCTRYVTYRLYSLGSAKMCWCCWPFVDAWLEDPLEEASKHSKYHEEKVHSPPRVAKSFKSSKRPVIVGPGTLPAWDSVGITLPGAFILIREARCHTAWIAYVAEPTAISESVHQTTRAA